MAVAERHGVFIRDLEAHGAWLRKAQVMGVRRSASANETRLTGDKGQMRLIAQPLVFWIGKRRRFLRRVGVRAVCALSLWVIS